MFRLENKMDGVIPFEKLQKKWAVIVATFLLKGRLNQMIETFSGRGRPDWQSNPGTEVAVASLQNSNIKIAVN